MKAKLQQSTWAILAGCRLALALIVACGHLSFFYDESDTPIVHFIGHLNGSFAVLLFLTISGFSIAHSYAEQPEQYYMRRIWRILPVYAACVAVSFIPYLFHAPLYQPNGSSAVEPSTFLDTLLGALTFGILRHVDTNGPIWSLGVEVIWYALTPVIARWKSWAILAVAGVSAVACRVVQWPSPSPFSGHGLVFCLVSWAWLVGFLLYRHRESAWSYCLLAAAPILIGTYTVNRDWAAVAMCATFAGVVVASLRLRWSNKPAEASLKLAGDISYPLYLIHMPVCWFMVAIGFPISVSVALFLVFLASASIYRFVDLPSRELKRRILSRRHGASRLSTISPSPFGHGIEIDAESHASAH